MGDRRGSEWDDEPFGDLDEGKRRRWRRPWNVYLCFLCGTVGAFMLIGAVPAQHWPGAAGGLCVLAAAVAFLRADGPRPTRQRPSPPMPTLRYELTAYAVGAVLLIVGVVLTTI